MLFHRTRTLILALLIACGLSMPANAFLINPTDGWDGPGLGAATIDYYVGWSGAPDGNNGLTNGGGLSLAQIETELANAMASWSAVVDVTFNSLGNAVSTPGLAANPWGSVGNETLVFYFHGTEVANAFPFDGPGLTTVFAHAWGPPDSPLPSFEFAGNIHADEAENWLTGLADSTTYVSQGGIDLETILLHELGHSLGLGHEGTGFANPGGSVMEPFSNIALATLQADDIAGARQLYSFQGQDWSNGDPNVDPDPDPKPIPEPGTFVLFATGLLGFAVLRRRKKSATP